ncbi:putative uncharacterized protein DDB_G0267840 [Culicoides brevitarsis]|uniref:putative uncharacterized protein DDB_G0267840 n=1 Tax=Culicoides brevitarsis TaxID=469753 RepID=UPI00307BDFBB
MDISESFRPEDLSKTDFFDFVTAAASGNNNGQSDMGTGNTTGNEPNTGNDQPLQGFDQFWGPDKDTTGRLEQNMFDDLNRYVGWNQPSTPTSNSISNPPSINNTDGQIYTITVLNNSTEPWLRKDAMEATTGPSLDIDSILGFPNYIKQESFNYEDSGFATDSKDNLISPTQLTPPQSNGGAQQVQSTTNANLIMGNGTNGRNHVAPRQVIAFQNNNNDWQMNDHNGDQSAADSLLRNALQGKVYSKGMHLPNGVAILPNVKSENELGHVLFPSDHDMVYADSTLAPAIFEEHSMGSPGSQQQSVQSTTTGNVSVDEMFLNSLDPFSDDYEKIKRIATEVHQFCTDNNNYGEVIVEAAAAINNSSSSNNNNQTSSIVSTTTTSSNSSLTTNQSLIHSTSVSDVVTTTNPTTIRTKTTKKYKRASSNNNNNTTINNLNNNISNNNNNSTTSPTHLNGQRKERSLHYCSICSKGFKDKYSVNVHIRTHTGEKPFACSLCGKSFRQKAHLAKHYQTHIAQKNGNGQVKGSKNNHNNNNNNSNSTNNHAAPVLSQQSPNNLQPLPPPQSINPIQIQVTHQHTPLVITTPGQSTVVAIR